MSIDILNMRHFDENDKAIDIALPVIAIECEASPPASNYIDAYEEAVLKFISINMGHRAIANAMNTTDSMVFEVLSYLRIKSYVEKNSGEPWKITEQGMKYLAAGEAEETATDNTQYGFMFVNAIKKEVLPFFFQGDINQIASFKGARPPFKLTIEGDEQKTFGKIDLKRSAIQDAYKKFYHNQSSLEKYEEGKISYEEAVDLFEGLDDFDEVTESEDVVTMADSSQENLTKEMFIKPLKVAPIKKYLRIRIFIDPSAPSGYRVESPFMMRGCDNIFYLRQVQWLAASQGLLIENEKLTTFLEREIRKISPTYKFIEKDFDIWALEKLPLLRVYRGQFSNVYDDMGRIYSLMQNQHSLLDKENIVNNISRYVVESLLNKFFAKIEPNTLETISNQAQQELKNSDIKVYRLRIIKKTKLEPGRISWSWNYLSNAIGRMKTTKGNSIIEKFINLVVMNHYLGTPESDKFLNAQDIQSIYDIADKLNQIRRKVSHDTKENFDNQDYQYYISNVSELVNGLLESYRKD